MDDFLTNPVMRYYIAAALMAYPVARICRRAGLSAGYALLLAVPMIGYVAAAAVLTFKKWPAGAAVRS